MLAHLEVGVIRRKIVNRYMTSYNLLGNFAKITDTSFVYNGPRLLLIAMSIHKH